MKGIGIIGGMIPGVILFAILRISLDWGLTITPLGTLFFQLLPDIILGGILLGLMSSSVLLPPLLYLVTPLLSFADYSLPLLICLPREEGLILESSGDQALPLQP
jgi:hypothetical protein